MCVFNLINILAVVFLYFFVFFYFYFILLLFNLLAKAVRGLLQYGPNHFMENQNLILMGNDVKCCISFFLSPITSKAPKRTQMVYIVSSGLQHEGLQVTNLYYRRVL